MTRRTWVCVAALLALVPGSTCRSSDVRGQLEVPVMLKKGEWVRFAGRPLEIAFLRVLRDERCPKNATCIQQGDAVIQLQGKSAEGGFDTFVARLPGGAAPTDTTIPWDVWSGYRFRLLQLDPYPTAGVTVDSSAYVATLLVRKS
jgi:hypothetical protein